MRKEMPAQFEAAISSCKSVKDIRTACSTHPGLKEAIVMSIEPVKVLLESLFVRLKLKEIPFQVFHSSSSPELDEFWNVILSGRFNSDQVRHKSSYFETKAWLEVIP